MGCLACPIKDGVILAQRLEIATLRAEVDRLKQIIANGQTTAAGIVSYSAREMNGGGLPRGTWSLLKGRKEAAQEIDRVLR